MPIAGQWRSPTDWTPGLTGITGPWQDNVSTIPASLINGVLANQIALHALATDGFDLHDDVRQVLGTPGLDDRILVSDESAAGDPNRYLTMGGLRTWLNSHIAFDLHADVGTALTAPAGNDRLVLSDENVSGDPMRFLTLNGLVTWLRTQGVGGVLQVKSTATTGTGDGIDLARFSRTADPTLIMSVNITPSARANIVALDLFFDLLFEGEGAQGQNYIAWIYLTRQVSGGSEVTLFRNRITSELGGWHSGTHYDKPDSQVEVTYRVRGFGPDSASADAHVEPGASMAALEYRG